jgi:hypothetical protein
LSLDLDQKFGSYNIKVRKLERQAFKDSRAFMFVEKCVEFSPSLLLVHIPNAEWGDYLNLEKIFIYYLLR